MKFEKIERAFHLLLENVQNIQNVLGTNFYDALIEQNGIYLDGDTDLQEILKNNEKLRALHLTKEEGRRAYQFIRQSHSKLIISSHRIRSASY